MEKKSYSGIAHHLCCAVVVVVGVLLLYGTLIDRHGFTSHEKIFTYIRAHQFAREFLAGHIPPMTMPDAVYGAGYAFPHFYSPFPYWITTALTLLTGDCILGVNLSFLLSVLLSGLSIYLMSFLLSRDSLLALASALIYISLPYRFVDIFVRGALAESWTFIWYPIIFGGIWIVVSRRTLPWFLPCAIGGLFLTHNVMVLYFMPLCLVLGLLVMRWCGMRQAMVLLLGAVLGVGLAAWFILPQQFYLSKVWASNSVYMQAEPDIVENQRVSIEQFFHSDPDGWKGVSSNVDSADRMSFELGAGQLILPPIVFIFLLKYRTLREELDRRLAVLGAVAFVGWILCLAFMIYPSLFFLVLPKAFAYIQFPWRLLGLTAFLAPTAIIIFTHCLKLSAAARAFVVVASLLLLLIVPGYQKEKQVRDDWSNQVLTEDFIGVKARGGATERGEYLPKDLIVRILKVSPERRLNVKTLETDLGRALIKEPQVNGIASIVSYQKQGLDVTAEVNATTDSRIIFPLLFYDFYGAEADGSRELNVFSAEGLLGVEVPSGTHSIKVFQHLTTPSKAGILISIISAIGIVLLSIKSNHKVTKNLSALCLFVSLWLIL